MAAPRASRAPQLAASSTIRFADLPMPAPRPLGEPYGILVTGIGGTGVITVGALIGMAAHLEGKGCTVLDFTGLAQKNGAVMSHVRLAPKPEDLHAVRIAAGGADLLLGCDMVVAAAPAGAVAHRARRHPRRRQQLPAADRRLRHERRHRFRRRGHASARSATPRASAAIDFRRRHRPRHRAPGRFDRHQPLHAGLCLAEGPAAAVARGDRARHRAERRRRRDQQAHLRLGPARRARPRRASRRAAKPTLRVEKPVARTLPEIVAQRVELLTAYQDEAYAARYSDFVDAVAERRRRRARAGPRGLAEAVAQVALQADGLQGRVRGGAALHRRRVPAEARRRSSRATIKLSFHLAPPLFADRDPDDRPAARSATTAPG